ncbi:MAG: hypothetical protein ABI995_10865 [Acidobacteriota bacterium]
MKKTKERQQTKLPALPAEARRSLPWWPMAAAAAGLLVVFAAYGPALHGAFVFDDRFQTFLSADAPFQPFGWWIQLNRPLLQLTFWLNFRLSEIDPFGYHVTNVLLHYMTSVVFAFVVARLLGLAGTTGIKRGALGIFAGALFLLHPVNTESVAYVVSRSEVLSVLFYFSAFAVFLYRPAGPIGWGRSAIIGLFMAAALSTKEHTLTLPALLLLTDYYFHPKGIRENVRLYVPVGVATVLGAIGVSVILKSSGSAGFHVENLTPATYAFTQFRIIWTYVRLFFFPTGLNLDPDVAISTSLLDPGAILGLVALVAAVAACWIYRKRWPLASYGFVVFLLLLSPTSSFIPILDVMAEHRLYLPFLGLTLLSVELLRRIPASQATCVGIAAVAICGALTYQRSQVWSSPITLWADSVSKSPRKMRPNFQLGFAYYQKGDCANAEKYYSAAAGIRKPAGNLLMDWALALDCLERFPAALEVLRQAEALGESAPIKAQMAILYGKQQQWQQALALLAEAEKLDSSYPNTYVYRGDLYEVAADLPAAAEQYRKALQLAPWNDTARASLARVTAAGQRKQN